METKNTLLEIKVNKKKYICKKNNNYNQKKLTTLKQSKSILQSPYLVHSYQIQLPQRLNIHQYLITSQNNHKSYCIRQSINQHNQKLQQQFINFTNTSNIPTFILQQTSRYKSPPQLILNQPKLSFSQSNLIQINPQYDYQKQLNYNEHRINYFLETRVDCEGLSMSWQGYGLILHYSDLYFSEYPFTLKNRQQCFASFILIASKITQKAHLQMKTFINHIKLIGTNYQYFRQMEKLIIKRLNFQLIPETFPKTINHYMFKWDNYICQNLNHINNCLFFTNQLENYRRFRLVLYLADQIYVKSTFDLGKIKYIFKIAWRQLIEDNIIFQILQNLFQNVKEIQLSFEEYQFMNFFRQNIQKVDKKYEERNRYKTYAQFLNYYYCLK